jgi:hypothetical protein
MDGAGHSSNPGIVVEKDAITASIANVTIIDTGADSIHVSAGTLQVGAGVQVSGAGTESARSNGLVVSGGTVNITVAETETPTVFENNTQYGISVTGTGVLNISGKNTAGGIHSVVAKGNAIGNVAFESTQDATTSLIDGLYAVGNSTSIDGLLIRASSKIKVRNSIFLGNLGSGIRITSGGTNDLGGIDLGVGTDASSAGHNLLQAASGSTPNAGAGLCVDLGVAATGVLNAMGNQFAGVDCTTADPSVVTLAPSANCTTGTNLGLTAPAATVYTNDCRQQP